MSFKELVAEAAKIKPWRRKRYQSILFQEWLAETSTYERYTGHTCPRLFAHRQSEKAADAFYEAYWTTPPA
jgi:hypothetical protein